MENGEISTFEEANEDWAVVGAIYADANRSVKQLTSNTIQASIVIPISTENIVFARRVSDDLHWPRFRYWTLSREEQPLLDVKFYYNATSDDDDDDNHQSSTDVKAYIALTVGISIQRYPSSWPQDQGNELLEWLTNKAREILATEGQAYPVCDFLEHEALQFFPTDHQDEASGYSMIMLPPIKENSFLHNVGNYLNPAGQYEDKEDDNNGMSIEAYAKRALIERWKFHYTFDCAICMDTCSFGDGFEITCQHSFCSECISMYVKYKVADIATFRENPFTCPIEDCRKPMLVVGCAKKLLDEEEMAKVRLWYKNLKQPPCWALDRCLSKKCSAMNSMRRIDNHPWTFQVFCDECGVTWCELCVRRIKDGDHDKSCNQKEILQFCRRYLKATDELKEKCETLYPWIKTYAYSRAHHDSEALKWVSENGQTCPVCLTGVERIEGCFHMRCPCGTHFCFECGEQLYAPYYGTHHCWEQNGLEDVG
jgi:hypothetical protein